VIVCDLRPEHLEDVIRIDALHTGERKPDYWKDIFERFLDARRSRECVGLAVEDEGSMIGYLLGEVRAFEFGSEPCGWVFGVGVEADRLRTGVAGLLMDEARRRFSAAGLSTVRTMVRRNDVSVLSFFRSHGFVGGSFTQLESELEESS
jgi:ribosomal protein S18 acetylase RimI-like enzyme